MYKGSLLDVEKLVGQLKRSEKARLDTENRMMEIQHELTVVNEKSIKQTNNIKSLSEDLKIYKDKLRSTEEKLKKISVSIFVSCYIQQKKIELQYYFIAFTDRLPHLSNCSKKYISHSSKNDAK